MAHACLRALSHACCSAQRLLRRVGGAVGLLPGRRVLAPTEAHLPCGSQVLERSGALRKLRAEQSSPDRALFQQVRRRCSGLACPARCLVPSAACSNAACTAVRQTWRPARYKDSTLPHPSHSVCSPLRAGHPCFMRGQGGRPGGRGGASGTERAHQLQRGSGEPGQSMGRACPSPGWAAGQPAVGCWPCWVWHGVRALACAEDHAEHQPCM